MFYFHISTAPGAKQLREYYIKEAKESKITETVHGITQADNQETILIIVAQIHCYHLQLMSEKLKSLNIRHNFNTNRYTIDVNKQNTPSNITLCASEKFLAASLQQLCACKRQSNQSKRRNSHQSKTFAERLGAVSPS